MSDPITPLSEGAVGFMRRIFGPVASEIGEALADHVRAYRARNIKNIIEKAEISADGRFIEPLPPRISIPLIESASLEDNEILQEMWANLLVDAATHLSSRHNIFVDIMSQIGPEEAKFLELIFSISGEFSLILDRPSDLRPALLDYVKSSINWHDRTTEDDAKDIVNELMDYDFHWPVIVRSAEMYFYIDGESGPTGKTKKMKSFDSPISIDALGRQKLIEYFDLDFTPGWASPRMDGYFMTNLGVEFVKSCRKEIKV